MLKLQWRWVIPLTMLVILGLFYFWEKGLPKRSMALGPHVILVSIDGYRYDYTQRYQARNLERMANTGVAARSLVSVYPSSTFSNHYAIATGLYTENHGIVANHFYDKQRQETFSMRDRDTVEDGSWYGGLPLWVLAEKQGLKTATYFWVGTEADVNGVRPSFYFPYNARVQNRERIEQVKAWLQLPARQRPRLLTLYFSSVDTAGHQFGPESKEVGEAVAEVDELLGDLFSFVSNQSDEINIVIVSDHGMQQTDLEKTVAIDEIVDLGSFRVMAGGAQLFLYANDKEQVGSTYEALKNASQHYHVYLRDEVPQRYRFSRNPRVPDILIDATLPYLVGVKSHIDRMPEGMHGWDPSEQSMHGIFYAWGPAFNESMVIDSFENVHIYPMIARILDLEIQHEIDGRLDVLAPILASD